MSVSRDRSDGTAQPPRGPARSGAGGAGARGISRGAGSGHTATRRTGTRPTAAVPSPREARSQKSKKPKEQKDESKFKDVVFFEDESELLNYPPFDSDRFVDDDLRKEIIQQAPVLKAVFEKLIYQRDLKSKEELPLDKKSL